MYGTELVRLVEPSLCFAPLKFDELPRRLIGMSELDESWLPRLRVEEPIPFRLRVEPPPDFVSSRRSPLLVRFPNELLDLLRVTLRFWALAAPAVRLDRREVIWSAEETLEMIPADS